MPFNGVTRLDLNPETVLKEAAKKGLEGVVILGYTTEGEEYFSSSYADGGTVNWMLDRCKMNLLNQVDE